MTLPEKWLKAFPHPPVALAMLIHLPPEAVLGVREGHRIQFLTTGQESLV